MTTWFLTHRDGWSYDINARAVAAELSEDMDIRVVSRAEDLALADSDTLVDFGWMSTAPAPRLIRQVSSHRWSLGIGGGLSVEQLAERLSGCERVIVPSRRLEALLSAHVRPPVYRTPKGFSPELFSDRGKRSGAVSIGWAGLLKPDKGFRLLMQAAPDLKMATGRLRYEEMPGFYNAVDVIAVASIAEGDPRTLIEGMACGCFPVCCDVGIVPELVRHGDNGLVVERSTAAFREAFEWCRRNAEHVRQAGRRNAEEMLATRTWAHVAPAWRAAIG